MNDPKKLAVLSRDGDYWVATFNDGTTATLAYSRDAKGGDVARKMALSNPDMQIGVRSAEFGPNTVMSFGPVVWLKHGFEKELR